MYARRLTLGEQALLGEVQGIAFVFPFDMEAERKKAAENPQAVRNPNTWGCFADDGTLTAGLENDVYGMRYDGHTVEIGAIGGVASLPEYRMGGGVRLLLKTVLKDDKKKGRLFSVLYPFSHRYYRKFGYELCHEARSFLFPTQALAGYKLSAAVRMHRAEEGSAPFEAVYSRYAAGYNCAFVRGEAGWKRLLEGDHSKAKRFRYILSRDGEDTAYCMYRVAKDAGQEWAIHLTDYAFVDREALHDLLGFLYKLSAQLPNVHMEVPDDFEPSVLLEEPYDVKQHGISRTMARVLDVERVLSLMRHPDGEGSYVIAVADDFLPENAGTYRVAYGADGVRVCRDAGAACDLSMPVTTLAQVCLGFLSLDMALLKSDVHCFANHETLRRVFVRKPGLLSDRF